MPSSNMGDYIEGLESNDGNDAEKILGWNLVYIFRIIEQSLCLRGGAARLRRFIHTISRSQSILYVHDLFHESSPRYRRLIFTA